MIACANNWHGNGGTPSIRYAGCGDRSKEIVGGLHGCSSPARLDAKNSAKTRRGEDGIGEPAGVVESQIDLFCLSKLPDGDSAAGEGADQGRLSRGVVVWKRRDN